MKYIQMFIFNTMDVFGDFFIKIQLDINNL